MLYGSVSKYVNRIDEAGFSHASCGTSNPTRNCHKIPDLTGGNGCSHQGSFTSTSSAIQLRQDHPVPPVASYLTPNFISNQDSALMNESWLASNCSTGSTWLATDKEWEDSWSSRGAASLYSQNHSTSSSDHYFNELSQQTRANIYPDFPSGYEAADTVEPMEFSDGFHRIPLERPASNSQMTSAQASLFQALLSLGNPVPNDSSQTFYSPFQIRSDPSHPQTRPIDLRGNADCGSLEEDEDPEHIQTIICGQLVLDRSVESNSLPFALQSYAVWMRRSLFDPSRAAPKARDYIIRHFAESKQSRFRTILIANIFRTIVTKPTFDLSYLPKLSALQSTIQETLTDATRRKINPSRDIQIRESVRALEHTLELFAVARYAPLHVCLQLMREAAPVFRFACPEPMDRLVHLPGILMHPSANMRHYPVMDVYFSIITGLPTNLQYNTSLRSPVDTSVLYIENHLGLTWLYGQPDRITLILARTNSLYQEFGASVTAEIIQEIERDIRSFKVISGNSPEPSLIVMRLIVQECWRQVAYIYLYMTLCDADALDARVQTAQQKLMRLISDAKPAQALDMHLAPCLGIAGVVTHQPTERELYSYIRRALEENG
ncbi:unnamed protein product [Rhizoctonia solani]|uniref:Uncharacterized protein n=1 Tax=Rhizoctonia solani TaxID=456999 RepID=A0A8H3E064_9AGAM|nr:unnamed protein product [Rhizoctonia solani]